MQHLEAVFEQGVLRPLQPLSLDERQHVLLTITDLPDDLPTGSARSQEQEWIRTHGSGFSGQWVALQGSKLISHGRNARAVRDEARAKGIDRPLFVRLPLEPGRPSAGWL